jgi:hypothetical protein
MYMNREIMLVVILLGTVLSTNVLGCKYEPLVELVGINKSHNLNAVTKPGDEYSIICDGATKISGAVNNNHILALSNGAQINVINMARSEVLSVLR